MASNQSEPSPPPQLCSNDSNSNSAEPPMDSTTRKDQGGPVSPPGIYQCPICSNKLTDCDPKLLPCFHSLCGSCVKATINPATQRICCPKCRQEAPVNEIIDNRFLLGSMQENNNDDSEKEYTCTNCDDKASATSYCVDCNEWLCSQCTQAHERVKLTKEHIVKTKNEAIMSNTNRIMYCPLHKQEQLKLFCESCDQLTCRDCQLSGHMNHRYKFVTDASTEFKQMLGVTQQKLNYKKNLINMSKSTIAHNFRSVLDQEASTTNAIKNFAIRFITEINRRSKQLLSELNAICHEKKGSLAAKGTELQRLWMKLETCERFIEAAMANGDDVALLHSKRLILRQVYNLLRVQYEMPPKLLSNIDIKFNYESNYLSNYINSMGSLTVDHLRPTEIMMPNQRVAVSGMHTNEIRPPVPPQQLVSSSTHPSQRNVYLRNLLEHNPTPDANAMKWRNAFAYGPSTSQANAANNQHAAVIKLNNTKPLSHFPFNSAAPKQQLPPFPATTGQHSYGPVSHPPFINSGSPQSDDASSDRLANSNNVTIKQESSADASPTVCEKMKNNVNDSLVRRDPSEIWNTSQPPDSSSSPPIENKISGTQNNEVQIVQTYNVRQKPGNSMDLDPNDDWCSVCHDGGSLLCCGFCPRVFHLNCHVPPLAAFPNENEVWQCFMCIKPSNIIKYNFEINSNVLKSTIQNFSNETDFKICSRILLELFCDEHSPDFQEPVNIDQVPNYFTVIQTPMDLGTIKNKIFRNGVYFGYANRQEFISDVQLMFQNCFKFNEKNSVIYAKGLRLHEHFNKLLKAYFSMVWDRNNETSQQNNESNHQNKKIKLEENMQQPCQDKSEN